MKKLLVLAFCAAFAGFASAGSIQWNLSLGRNGFIADSTGAAMTGTLYFLLTSDATSLADTVSSGSFESALSSASLGSMDLTNGKNTAVNTVTSSALTVGEEYSFSLVVFDTVNQQYYVSASRSQLAYDESAEVVTANSVSFGTQHVGSTYSATWSPTSVPEPSTAALALAGLALLLKRRKA